MGGYPPHRTGTGGFQYQLERKLIERILRWRVDGEWEYTLLVAARAESGFEAMEEYIWRIQNTVAHYIAT